MTDQQTTTLHRVALWSLESDRDRADPWGEITLLANATGPGGETLRIPAFWDGGRSWRFRLSVPLSGTWRLTTECSDAGDTGLHRQSLLLEVAPTGEVETNPFYRHGPVRLSPDQSRFEHADGTPFHWFADTWWMLATNRVSFPEGFGRLTARRRDQGFSVVQFVVGFQPDTTPFDGRDANAGGSPWLPGYASINPRFFQAVDERLEHLIDNGILPCILGGWGYHALFMGKERMIAHWRYLVARYGAWPVVWCLAGEGAMAYYLSADKSEDTRVLQQIWPEVARVVHATDPWRRPVTLHPRRHSWDDTADPATLDFHMTQAGHLPNAPRTALEAIAAGRARFPGRVIINAEPPYEAHAGANLADVQRYSFWSSMLSGASGYTYGAAGVFQANDRERPTGDRPDGGAYDAVYWDEGMTLAGGEQLAKGNALLKSLGHHKFTAHPEWASLDLRGGHEAYFWPIQAFAAGIPEKVRLIYLPLRWYHWDGPLVHALEPGVRYRAAYLETDTLRRHELGIIAGDEGGEWRGPTLPHMFDWLLLLEAVS
jgi:hypothetical protein